MTSTAVVPASCGQEGASCKALCISSERVSAVDTNESDPSSKDIPIWFSVFFGDPNPSAPNFDHARFDAEISEQVIELNQSMFKHYGSVGLFNAQSINGVSVTEETFGQSFTIFRALATLSYAFTDLLLSCTTQECVICQKLPALSLIYRPLCIAEQGYAGILEGGGMYKLMSTIASHVSHINQQVEVDWTIGHFLLDRPYICSLAVPVCSESGECHYIASQMTQEYIEGILTGLVKPKELGDDFVISYRQTQSPPSSRAPGSTGDDGSKSEEDAFTINFPETSIEGADSNRDKLYSIGITMFVGRPSLKIGNLPHHENQLSCLVFSSLWPRSFLPDVSKTETAQAMDYCRIVGYYEQYVLEIADSRCAVCAEPVRAKSLIHRPLLFDWMNEIGLEDNDMRGMIMRLCRFVPGRWLFPEMNAMLGGDSEAHIFELAVPICEGKTVCEEVARTSAREFAKLLLPPGQGLAIPGLDSDFELFTAEGGGLLWEPENTELMVEKLGHECLTFGADERDEDPMDCSLTIAKLRRWYELCYSEEEIKRECLKNMGYKRAGDWSGTDTEESEDEISAIWVYTQEDQQRPDTEYNEVGDSEQDLCRQAVLARESEHLHLFEPLLTFDFWLLSECLSRLGYDDNAPSLGEDDEAE